MQDAIDVLSPVDAITGPAPDSTGPTDVREDTHIGPDVVDGFFSDVQEFFDAFFEADDGVTETVSDISTDTISPPEVAGEDVIIAPPTPDAPQASFYSEAPCGFVASYTTSAYDQMAYATCGGSPEMNGLFRYDGDNWNIAGTIDGYPANHVHLPDDYHAIMHSEMSGQGLHGITIIDGITGETTDIVDLGPELTWDDNDIALLFNRTFPNGAILVGGEICVASSNLDGVSGDPGVTSYNPGTVSCFQILEGGTIFHNMGHARYTSGPNPTGMVLIDEEPIDGGQRFAVLSSNGYDLTAESNAALDIFSHPVLTKETIIITAEDGSPVTAQISPTIAMTSSGILLVGIQAPTNALYGIDPTTGEVVFRRELEGVTNFVSSINSYGDIAAISDFGGKVMFINTAKDGWEGTPETEVSGMPGPAFVSGDTLFQSIGMGADGEIWTLGLSGL